MWSLQQSITMDFQCSTPSKLIIKLLIRGCAFHSNPKSNITKEIFDAFRAEGLWAGAYFSKPDWHNDNYWDPYFPPRDRNVNYDPELYPEKWKKYVDFTHKSDNGINELTMEK